MANKSDYISAAVCGVADGIQTVSSQLHELAPKIKLETGEEKPATESALRLIKELSGNLAIAYAMLVERKEQK
jgi:hypothetical protein